MRTASFFLAIIGAGMGILLGAILIVAVRLTEASVDEDISTISRIGVALAVSVIAACVLVVIAAVIYASRHKEWLASVLLLVAAAWYFITILVFGILGGPGIILFGLPPFVLMVLAAVFGFLAEEES